VSRRNQEGCFKGPVEITIGRRSSNVRGDHVHIQIEDPASSATRVDVMVSLEAFAQAVLGLGGRPAEAEWIRTDLLGLKGEFKTVVVPGVIYGMPVVDFFDRVRKFEVDGWIPSLDADERKGSYNPHRLSDKGYEIRMRRWVKDESTEALARK